MDAPLNIPKADLSLIKTTIGDKLWRLTHLYKIVNKNTNSLEYLRLNRIQTLMYEAIQNRKPLREYILKYRQGGVSTFWVLWWLDESIFKANTTSAILADDKEGLSHLWNIVRLAYDQMPSEYKPRSGKYNEHELTFPDINSRVFVSLSIRSTRVDNLHISEICHMEAADIRASKAAVPPQGNITKESTAKGVGNEGHLLWEDAKFGRSEYRSHFFPWFIQSEYQLPLNNMRVIRTKDECKLAERVSKDWGLSLTDEQILWRRRAKQDFKELFEQEYPEDDQSAFLTSGNHFFDNPKIMALLVEARENEKNNNPPEETYDYTVWEAPQKGCTYCMAADVAEGIDGDFSVLVGLCLTHRRQAFRYRARVSVDAFYRVCDEWGRRYGNALLAVERNNHGHAVILGLYETMRYPNLFVQEQETRITKTRGIAEPKQVVKIGWDTTSITKPLMLDQLKEGIQGDYLEDVNNFQPEFEINDQIFLQEALTLESNGVSIGAAQGKHDDVVIAWAICFQLYLKLKSRLKTSSTSGILLGDSLKAVRLI